MTTQLEPLKDEEELLQSEKDSLESEMQIAKNDYDALLYVSNVKRFK